VKSIFGNKATSLTVPDAGMTPASLHCRSILSSDAICTHALTHMYACMRAGRDFNWVDVTLETYYVTQCNQYANGPASFFDMKLVVRRHRHHHHRPSPHGMHVVLTYVMVCDVRARS
jgi:hypothetical protein